MLRHNKMNKKMPKWFKLESAFILGLVIVTFILESAITIVPGHEDKVSMLFLMVYGVLFVIWFIPFIIILSNSNRK